MRNQIRWILQDFFGSKGLFFSLFLSLFVGFTGFTLVESLRSALEVKIQTNAKASLGADLSVSIRRAIRSDEKQKLEETLTNFSSELKTARMFEFFSMVVVGEDSRLVQVKAISPGFPFYGEIQLSRDKFSSGTTHDIFSKNIAWVYPELLEQLNLKLGETIKLGGVDFLITDTVKEDSSQTFRLASLAPKIYVGVNPILETGLISAGTTMTEAVLIQTPNDEMISRLSEVLGKTFEDPAFRIEDYKEESEDSGRALGYVLDYLGLVSLIALILSGVGASFLFKGHFDRQKLQVAIFNALGMRKKSAQWRILFELEIISLLAAAAAGLAAYFLFSTLQSLISTWVPGQLVFTIGSLQFLFVLLVALVLPLLFMGPWVWSLKQVSTLSLLREDVQASSLKGSSRLFFVTWSLFSLLFLWLLCFIQSKSYIIGSLFLGLLLLAFVTLLSLGFLITRALSSLKTLLQSRAWSLNYLLVEASRRFRSTIGFFIAFGLGGFLLFLIPVLKGSLISTIERPQGMKLPELFLFDIQDDQVQPLQKIIQSQKLEASAFSPLVRARILSINDESYERIKTEEGFKSREEEQSDRFRNRGVNLSYRDYLSDSEKILEGEFFNGSVKEGALPELSVEFRYAERVGLKLGDKMKFDVQGVEIEGKVTSLREVRWNSFQPNFFVLVQPGLLEDAPKTHLVSLYNFENQDAYKLQGQLSRQLSNVSIVDVRKLVAKAIEISEQFTVALQAMAVLSLVVGLIIFISLCLEESRKKVWDYALLKVLGAKKKNLQFIAVWQGVIIGVLALTVGLSLSIGISYILLSSVFDTALVVPWGELGILFLVVLGGLLFTSNIILSRVYRVKPALLLRSERQGV